MDAIFEFIIKYIPDPKKRDNDDLIVQISMLDYDNYLGRIYSGGLRLGQQLCAKANDGTITKFKVIKLYIFEGLHRIETDTAEDGQIVIIAGNSKINVSDTLYEEGER